ncbi:MAG: hypothetical protein NTW86_27925 [Candidatus Sumerlaeota bacterium]|nr:hypothetical protein [Candidatus Sumerlaeota bacterium]
MRTFVVLFVCAILLSGCASPYTPATAPAANSYVSPPVRIDDEIRPSGSRRVAIMDFQNATGDAKNDGLQSAIPEFLSGLLVNESGILVVERQDLDYYLKALGAEGAKRSRYNRWRDLGEALGVDYFIQGSISQLENNYIVEARMFSVGTGLAFPGSAQSVSVGRAADLYPQIKQLGKFFAYQVQNRKPAAGQE